MKRLLIGTSQSLTRLGRYVEQDTICYPSCDIVMRHIKKGDIDFLECDIAGPETDIERFLECVVKSISRYILEVWEPDMIRNMLMNDFCYFDNDEMEEITRMAAALLRDITDLSSQSRYSIIKNIIAHSLMTQGELVIEGLLRFRFKTYMNDLHDAVEQAVDEYLMDREYHEFVKLLRYFLEMQEPRPGWVHLICGTTANRLVNEEGMGIIKDAFSCIIINEAHADDEGDVHIDDIVVSNLITLAPEHVKIHILPHHRKLPVIAETVQHVFQDRANLCFGCSVCRRYAEAVDAPGT